MLNYRMFIYVTLLLLLLSFLLLFEVRDVYQVTLGLKNILGINSLIYLSIGYTIILALPFFPGVELGICIMCLYGRWGIIAVYFSTILGLCLSFLVGKYYGKIFNKSSNRITKIFNSLTYFVPRTMSMALLFNAPGNAFLGGGGGIAFSLGLDKRFELLRFIGNVAIVTSPIPLLAFFGLISLNKFL